MAEKDLRFTVSIAPDVPRAVVTDQHRLQQVLRNLLSNAVKFTSAGEVRMEIRLAAKERFSSPTLRGDQPVVAFSVSDTGIGIPPEQLKVIFEAFQQADGTISRKFGGTGLGLSISREIARLIGGAIHAESEPGLGSTFTLFLPLRYPGEGQRSGDGPAAPQGELPATVPSPGAPAPVDLSPGVADDGGAISREDRVMLVALEDPEVRARSVEAGHAHGFKVLATDSAADAVDIAHTRRPAAMVVGMELPGPHPALAPARAEVGPRDPARADRRGRLAQGRRGPARRAAPRRAHGGRVTGADR